MNNKQIGGLENATDNEYIFEVKKIYNEMISTIKSKDIKKINEFEGEFMKMFNDDIVKIFNSGNNNITSIGEGIDRFIGIEDIKYLFNNSLYKLKDYNKNTAFYDLIIEIDKYIEKNQLEFINKKLDYDIFYFKLSNLVKNFDCKKKLGNVNNNLSLMLHILSLKIICILNKRYIKYKLYSEFKKYLITELYQCYGLKQGTYEITDNYEPIDTLSTKQAKSYISTQIIVYDKLFEQDLCSPYELELIKQNTNKFDTPKKLAVVNGIVSAIMLSVIASIVYASVTSQVPGASFPLYVTPFLSIFSSFLGTSLSQQYKTFSENSIKYIDDKGMVKSILKNWNTDILKTNKQLQYNRRQSCKEAYTKSIDYINEFNKKIADNYEKYLFQFEVYRKLFDLVCDDSVDTNKINNASLFSNNEFNIKPTDNIVIKEEVISQQLPPVPQPPVSSHQQSLLPPLPPSEEYKENEEDYINSYQNDKNKKYLFYKLKKLMEANPTDIDNDTNKEVLFLNLQEDKDNNTMKLNKGTNIKGNMVILKDFLINNPKIFEKLKEYKGGSKTRKNKKSKKSKKYIKNISKILNKTRKSKN